MKARCPSCLETMHVDVSQLGTTVICPSCQKRLNIPKRNPDSPVPQTSIPSPPIAQPIQSHQMPAQAAPAVYDYQGNSHYQAPSATQPNQYGAGFCCPYCNCTYPPRVSNQISTAGWVMFVVMLLVCLPLFWIGLLMTEPVRHCVGCGIRLG